MGLKLANNSKVRFKPNHLNTFGLNYGKPEDGGTCPGATAAKGGCLSLKTACGKTSTCYMSKLVKAYPNLKQVLEYNTDLLKNKSQQEMTNILEETVNSFIAKNKGTNLYFRLHYSGDFFSEEYTKAWHDVIQKFPQVQFWGYTRSSFAIPLLIELKNLALYFSADEANWQEAQELAVKYKDFNNFGLSYMGAVPVTDIRFVKCPETYGKLENGKVGACSKCQLCFKYSNKIKLRNINFKIH